MLVSHPFVFKYRYKSMHKPVAEHIGSLLLQTATFFSPLQNHDQAVT